MLTLSLTSQHTFSKYPTPCNTPFVCLFSKLYLCFYCVSAFYIYFDFGCQDRQPQIKCTIIITIVVKILLVTFATAACCISEWKLCVFVLFCYLQTCSVTSGCMFLTVSITVAIKIQLSEFLHSSNNNECWNVYPEEFQPQTSTFILLVLSYLCSHG